MKENISNKSLIVIILAFFLILAFLALLFFSHIKNTKTVEAVITYVGKDYIVAQDSEKEEYSIETNDDFEIGDRISFTMKNIKANSSPIKGDVDQIHMISKNIQFSVKDSQNQESTTNQNSSKETTNSSQEQTLTDSPATTSQDVVNYFDYLNRDLDKNDPSLSQSLKKGFVTVVDFLFYGGTIKNKTFSELSNEAKIKVLKLALSIDHKIEEKFPNYKEEISATSSKTYTNIKAKVIEKYLDLTTTICKDNQELCINAKEGLAELKKSFSLTWDFIKEISGVGVTKLKNWYEVWKDSE